MSSRSPAAAAPLAAPTATRRRPLGRRLRRGAAPYALLLPAAAVIAAVLGYPLYYLVRLSFQHYGLFQLVRHKGESIGTANYAEIFHDSLFWHVVLRTIAFTFACVSLTIVLGTLVALLLTKVGPFIRLLLTAGLIFVWATPVVVAVDIWQWMVDYEFGVANWTLTALHLGVFNQVWIIRNGSPSTDYYLMSIYAYVESFKISEYGLGSAIALVMVAIMLLISFVYIRQMVRIGDAE